MTNNNINNLANSVAKLSNTEYVDFWDALLKRRQPKAPEVPSETINKYVETLKELGKEQKFETEGTISFKVKLTESVYLDRLSQEVCSDSTTVEISDLKTDLTQDAATLKHLEDEISYAVENSQLYLKEESAKVQKYLAEVNPKVQTLMDEICDVEAASGAEVFDEVFDRYENRKKPRRRRRESSLFTFRRNPRSKR